MGNYKRNVTYFYQYNKGNMGATAGFIKMEIRGDFVKITINIQEPYKNVAGNPYLYFYHEVGDYLSAIKICEVERQGGVLTMQIRTPWKKVFDTERDIYTFDGALVMYNDNDYYLGDFKDRDRSTYEIKIDSEAEKEPTRKAEKEPVPEAEKESASEEQKERVPQEEEESVPEEKIKSVGEVDKERVMEEEKKPANDPFENILSSYPKLPMYNADELFECVRINPRDIGKLDIGNWKLGTNSFLTHGFYTYQYLMLGKMMFQDGKKHAVLGVPGIYSNRDKYLANMFGFEQFIPVKRTGMKTGQFGYWIVEISQ